MAGPIDALQAAGYSGEEIATWSQQRRNALAAGGFKDNEIDAYFTGGVVAPEKIPPALENRIEGGNQARKREGGILQTVPQFVDLISTPDGRAKMWDAVTKYPAEFIKGLKETGETMGAAQQGEVDLNSDEGVDRVIGVGMLVAIGRLNKLPRTAKTSGMSVAAGGETLARIERNPTGSEIHEVPIGGLPNSADFATAAKAATGGEAPLAVQEKLLKTYEDHGRLPAEVAHDAQSDPVVAQRLLSKDPQDLPYVEAYHGSPHDFAAFSSEHIGAGEGAQSYGHGLYFAENDAVARSYRETLSPRAEGIVSDLVNEAGGDWKVAADRFEKTLGEREGLAKKVGGSFKQSADDIAVLDALKKGEPGSIYQVRIHADKEAFLDWDKPIGEQSPQVRAALAKFDVDQKSGAGDFGAPTFRSAADSPNAMPTDIPDLRSAEGTAKLREAGIPGIKYLDEGSRSVDLVVPDGERVPNDLTHNIVLFDDKLVEITHKNGEPVTGPERAQAIEDMRGGGGGGSGGTPPSPPPEGPKPPPYSDAQKTILDKISVGESEARRPWSWSKLYTDAIDDLHPLKAVSEDTYQLARLTRGQFGKSDYFINHATFDFNTFRDTGKPLKEILAPLKNDLDGLRAYAAASRAIELEGRGIKSGFDTEPAAIAPPLISNGLEAARTVVAEGRKQFEQSFRESVDYQNHLTAYLRDSGMLSEDGYRALVEANKNYVPFFRVMDDGPKVQGKGAGSSLGPGDPIKRIKGSSRDIVDPLESIIKNTYAYISIAERNAAGIELIDALKAQGFKAETKAPVKADPELTTYLKEQGVSDPGALAEFVQRGVAENGDVISAYRNGVREEVVIKDDPDLVAAFRGIDRQSVGTLTRIFATPARMLRAGSTITPDFIARNLIRDFVTAFINTKGIVFSPIDTLSGLKSVLREDASWGDWVKGGGANSTMVALDRSYLQESLSKLSGETGLMERGWNVVTSPWRGLRMVSELIENATRVGEFKKAVQGPSKAEIQSAAFDAREVTLDFARMGAKMRAYNMVTAFANAQIQGVDRIVRAFADRPVNTSLKIAGGITLPSVLLWWANHEDQRYQELPHWQKDLFWIIPTDKWEPIDAHDAGTKPSYLIREKNGKLEFNNGSIWRIPKPFELGVVFGSGVERVLDYHFDKNPEAFSDFTKSMVQAFTPNYIPTAVQPMMEQFANRSTFTDRTLIPADMEKHLPEYQYTPYTTQLSRKLGQMVSAFPGMREAAVTPGVVVGPAARALTTPILIENYVRSWTGGMGMYMLQAADLSLRKAGVLPDPVTPTPTLADIPFIKAFAVRYPSAGTQSIQDFYDDHEKQKRFFDTWMARAKEGDTDAMRRIQDAGGPQMFMRLDAIKQTLTEHSHLIRDIYKYPDMPGDEKRQLIDGLYFNMINVGRAGRQMQHAATPAN